jgi:hypothetical protein
MAPIGHMKQEATFSGELRRVLQRRGLWTLKTNERARRGIPDIYLTGGQWIESKIIASLPTIRNFPLKHFTGVQRITLDTLVKKGDVAFAAILWLGDHNRSFTFLPWYEFRRIRVWDVYTLTHFSQPYIGEGHIDMDKFCWEGPKWNRDRWTEEVWNRWPHRNNERIYGAAMQINTNEELEGADAPA